VAAEVAVAEVRLVLELVEDLVVRLETMDKTHSLAEELKVQEVPQLVLVGL
jgi:hypothetical protein